MDKLKLHEQLHKNVKTIKTEALGNYVTITIKETVHRCATVMQGLELY